LTLILSVAAQNNDRYQLTIHDVITFLYAMVRKTIITMFI